MDSFIYEEDYVATEARDYIVTGDTEFYRKELKSWGAIERRETWIIENTDHLCQDFMAIEDLGLLLLPIQESSTEKMLTMQLKGDIE